MWILKFAITIAVNAFALVGLSKWLPGFHLAILDYKQVILAAVIFTVLNSILKPILKMVLGPVIIFTLGLGLIVVNMIVLYALDLIVENITIEGPLTLLYASLIVGGVNFLLHFISHQRK